MSIDAWARPILAAAWPSSVDVTPQGLQAAQAISRGEGTYGYGWKGDCVGSNNWGAVQQPCSSGGCSATDTHPTDTGGSIPYAACFRVYASPEAGASGFLSVLLRGGVRDVINTGDALAIASAMHDNHYFEGFGSTVDARIKNYAKAIAYNAGKIATALGEPAYVTLGPGQYSDAGGGATSPAELVLWGLAGSLLTAGAVRYARRKAA